MRATYWMLAGVGMLTAVAIFVLATPGATAWYNGVQCPASGDWSVSSSTQYYDETLYVYGNIKITSDLTLTRCTVWMTNSNDGGYAIDVASGSSLTVYDSNIWSYYGSSYTYKFQVYGSMWINQSTIECMWGSTGSWTGGIQIYSSNVWIGNSTMRYGKTGGIYINKCSPWIYNNNIYSNGASGGSTTYCYGIYAIGDSTTKMNITTNRIYQNTYSYFDWWYWSYYYYGYGIRTEYLNSNDAIYYNTIYDNGHQSYSYKSGYQLYLYYSNPTLTGNQLSNGNYQLYCYYSNPPTINGGTISGFADYYSTTYGVYAQNSGLSFANVSFTASNMYGSLYGIYATSYSPVNVTDCDFTYQYYGWYSYYAIYMTSYSPLKALRSDFNLDSYYNYGIYANSHSNVEVTDSNFYNYNGYFYGVQGSSNCKVNISGTSMYTSYGYGAYLVQVDTSSALRILDSLLDITNCWGDARFIQAYSSSTVYVNNTIFDFYYNTGGYQQMLFYSDNAGETTICNSKITSDSTYCYYWYPFYYYNSKLTMNDTTIIDRYGNYQYDFYFFYMGWNAQDLTLTNVKIDFDAQMGGSGYGYFVQGEAYNSKAKFTLNGVTITGTVTMESFNGFQWTYGDYTIRNSKIDITANGVQSGVLLYPNNWDNTRRKVTIDNSTINYRTANTPSSRLGIAVIQGLYRMNGKITNSTFTTVNTDGSVNLQMFWFEYEASVEFINCTIYSDFGHGSGPAPTIQWVYISQAQQVNFTGCNITIDIEDQPIILKTFIIYYQCGQLNFDRTNIYWNVDAPGTTADMVTFSGGKGSETGLQTLILKNSKLEMVVSEADCAVSLLKITPDSQISSFKVVESVVNLEYLVPTTAPVAAIQMAGSDMVLSDLRMNLKAPAGGQTEIIGISIEAGAPTFINVTVQGNGNGRIAGFMCMLGSTPTLSGCRINNTYIGIAGDFFGMPYIVKSSTENCTIGLGLQNFCNATVVDSTIKGRIAVQLKEGSWASMFTSTISGSVTDWELNGNSTAWLLDCKFKPATSQNFQDGGSRLMVNWYLSLWVTWQNNRDIPGADVVMRNAQASEFMRAVTDLQGKVARFVVVEYVQTQAAKAVYSPYIVNVTSGGVSGEQSVVTDVSKEEHIIIKDDLLPVLEILEPLPGTIQNFVRVTMLGTASDVGAGTDYIMVSYDGKTWVKVDAAPVWMEVLEVPEGTWTLTARLLDRAGNEATATREVVIDLTRPFITVTSPPDKSLGNVIGVDLVGSVEPGSTLTVNFRAASVSAEGAFAYPLRLVEGRNDFVLFARDRAGNDNTTTWTLYLDLTPPPLTVIQPKDGLLTNQSSVTVSGKTEAGAAVTVNGEPVAVGTDGAFSASHALVNGPNFITVVASDAAGNRNTVLRSVVMDSDVRLEVSDPAEKLLTTQVTILVIGSTDTDALVRLNGAVVSVEADGNFSVTYTLEEGWNTLVFTASDRAGNFRSVTRTVRLDTVPPIVEVGTPQAGAMVRTVNVAVSGICEPGITLTVNGQPADTASGVFNATATLPEGANRLLVEGRDAAGNKVSFEVPITVDTTAPSINIVEPRDGFRTTERSVLIVGLTEPGAAVTVNDVPAVVDTFGKFTVQLTLGKGGNTVTATSTDAAGNTASEKVTIKVVDKPATFQAGDWWWTALGLLLALGIMIPLTMYLVNSWQKARIDKGGSK